MTTTLAASDQLEIMDLEKIPERELLSALKFLDFVNRWFGGYSLFTKSLSQWLPALPPNQCVRILDVGTGSGDLLIALSKWARKNNIHCHLVGIEPSAETANYARNHTAPFPDIEIRIGSLWDLRPGEKFDFVFSNLVLHHISKSDHKRFLEKCALHASIGILAGDLLRSWKNYWLVSAAGFLWGNHIVRNDGPLSVRRSLTMIEAQALIDKSKLPLSAQQEPWCRLSIGGKLS